MNMNILIQMSNNIAVFRRGEENLNVILVFKIEELTKALAISVYVGSYNKAYVRYILSSNKKLTNQK